MTRTRRSAAARRRSKTIVAAVLAATTLGAAGGTAASAAAELCPGADRLVVVLDGPVSKEAHPWADVARLPDDAPLRLLTTDGTEDVLWARPTEGTGFEELAGWLIQQSGVADVQCPPADFVADVELLPFPEVIERPDPGGGVVPEPPGRGGGRGGEAESPTPAPDGGTDVGSGQAPALPATGLPSDLLLLAFSFGAAGGIVLGATRVSV